MSSPGHIFTRVGGTRFVTTVGCGVVNTLLLMGGFLTGDQFVDVTMWTVSVFIGSHAGQNIAGMFANRRNNQPDYSAGENNVNRQY